MTASHISLLDLSKQLNFQIDEEIKKQLCFAETLIISCGHLEGDVRDDNSESDWTCEESSESEISEEVPHESYKKEKAPLEEEKPENAEEDIDNDFYFYFFPDCSKPLPIKDSKASIIIENGLPKLNPASAAKHQDYCTCVLDKSGKCPCVTKVPCSCGAKVHEECKCLKLENICLCDDGKPQVTCTCKPSEVCLCNPDSKPRPICTCAQINKPCICHKGKFPCPICVCECKPKCSVSEIKIEEMGEDAYEEENKDRIENLEESEKQPCTCQQEPRKKVCFCKKGKECICENDLCICDIRPPCVCESIDGQEPPCKDDEIKSVCSCPVIPKCTCSPGSPSQCSCFPKPGVCTCGEPLNCKCFKSCECTEPCICDIQPKSEAICECPENRIKIADGLVCTCPPKKEKSRKLKKTRAGKHGYRWCRDVDPKHTFFDYAYDRHKKISYKEQEKEKLKILGLYEEEQTSDVQCPIHEIKAPEFKKRIRKPSLDCCSAVGGISISVETLGEDEDKFLVQVVSHSSKNGAKAGAKLVSILDRNLHTMEESRNEQITKKDITKERRSYMTICESGYYNKVTRICGERHFVKRIYHSFEDARNFLLEGANVILLRYFAINRYKGTIKTDTVLIDGTICESIYVCMGTSQAIVNGKPLFVIKVERHIIEPSGYIHQTLIVLTLKGYLVSLEWADNSYIIHLNPLLRIVPEKDEIEPHEPCREKWRNDLQLFSDYLDFKSTRSSEGARYVTENGELAGTIRDYLQTLLLLRPHDALHFTRHYFGAALSALDLPHNEYFDPCTKHVRYYFFEE
ncbi:uncharacterized protein LOC119834543 [Zerene cesonia]|uniref:uncharacterized protein LOC119834543 n=1 Tax=Zerene cesonia TaxID=33412 RepID=UPI0018E51934|nr:uncharacterized protein LOC119834543 [Zerene cesonia]